MALQDVGCVAEGGHGVRGNGRSLSRGTSTARVELEQMVKAVKPGDVVEVLGGEIELARSMRRVGGRSRVVSSRTAAPQRALAHALLDALEEVLGVVSSIEIGVARDANA